MTWAPGLSRRRNASSVRRSAGGGAGARWQQLSGCWGCEAAGRQADAQLAAPARAAAGSPSLRTHPPTRFAHPPCASTRSTLFSTTTSANSICGGQEAGPSWASSGAERRSCEGVCSTHPHPPPPRSFPAPAPHVPARLPTAACTNSGAHPPGPAAGPHCHLRLHSQLPTPSRTAHTSRAVPTTQAAHLVQQQVRDVALAARHLRPLAVLQARHHAIRQARGPRISEGGATCAAVLPPPPKALPCPQLVPRTQRSPARRRPSAGVSGSSPPPSRCWPCWRAGWRRPPPSRTCPAAPAVVPDTGYRVQDSGRWASRRWPGAATASSAWCAAACRQPAPPAVPSDELRVMRGAPCAAARRPRMEAARRSRPPGGGGGAGSVGALPHGKRPSAPVSGRVRLPPVPARDRSPRSDSMRGSLPRRGRQPAVSGGGAHLLRLPDARGLDDQVVKPALARQPAHLLHVAACGVSRQWMGGASCGGADGGRVGCPGRRGLRRPSHDRPPSSSPTGTAACLQQVVAQRAADAAVLHLHQALLGLQGRGAVGPWAGGSCPD